MQTPQRTRVHAHSSQGDAGVTGAAPGTAVASPFAVRVPAAGPRAPWQQEEP